VTGKRDPRPSAAAPQEQIGGRKARAAPAHPVPPDRTSAPQGLTQFSSIFFSDFRDRRDNALEELVTPASLSASAIIGRVLALAVPLQITFVMPAGPGSTPETVDTYPVNAAAIQ